MEAVTRITAGHISFESLAKCIQSALVRMTRNAMFILPDEHGVVMHFGAVFGRFRAFID